MPASPPSPAGAARSILLVEEYDALAIAIGSALRKFAPGFRVDVVSSPAEAEAAATAAKPELLVIDFDPPPRQAVAFFENIRASLPETRVLVICPGVPRELLPARGRPAGLQFIDKPFDVAELGAVVQKSLARQTGGTIRDLGLAEMLPLLCAAATTAVLQVQASGRRSGEIHLANGQIVHAKAGGWIGLEALQEMLGWRSPRLTEAEAEPNMRKTIRGSWQSILRDAIGETAPREAEPTKQPATARAKPTGAATGKKLVVIDDTEMLLVFVEEILSTADPSLEIVTAGTGLDGIEQVAAANPDLVLLDYSLPDITGDEVCQRLLASEKTARTPVVMMSGHVPEMTATEERFENVVATIAKPFLSHQLLDLVTSTLAQPPAFRPRVKPSHEVAPSAVVEALPLPETAAKVAPPTPAPKEEIKPLVHLPFPTVLPPPAPPQPAVELPGATPIPFVSRGAGAMQAREPAETFPSPQIAIALPTPMPQAFATPLAPVYIPAAKSNSVLLSIPLEVVALQFSPALQMAAIRARPCSTIVSLHIEPGTLPGVVLPEAGFELGAVDLDARGQIEVVRLSPTRNPRTVLEPRQAFPVAGLAVLPADGGKAMQLIPSPTTSMKLELEAPFELAGVELSATFGVRNLVLKARGGRLRVRLDPQHASGGAAFETAQVLLNRSGRIDEILLDAVAEPESQSRTLAAMR